MRLYKIFIFLIVLFFIVSLASAQYNITRSVFSNGGALITGDNQNIRSTVGQTLIGDIGNSTYQSRIGFWYTVDWIVSDITNPENLLPMKFELFQNYPNPFNPVTTIRYALPKQADVLLEVYNLLGQSITTLVNEQMPAGFHDVQFGANNLPTGYYIYRIQTDGFNDVKKMVLVK